MSFAVHVFKSEAVIAPVLLTVNSIHEAFRRLEDIGHELTEIQKLLLMQSLDEPIQVSVALMSQTLDYASIEPKIVDWILAQKEARMVFVPQTFITHADFRLNDVQPMIDLAERLSRQTGISAFVALDMYPSEEVQRRLNNGMTDKEQREYMEASLKGGYKAEFNINPQA